MALTYSFLDVNAAISGPGGNFQIGQGAGVSAEGVVIAPTGDKNVMLVGADGEVMHSLLADKSGTLTVNVLKTSETNANLQDLYNFQTASAANHGQNSIVLTHNPTGDVITCNQAAFKNMPTHTYAQEGGITTWVFDVGKIDVKLGRGAN